MQAKYIYKYDSRTVQSLILHEDEIKMLVLVFCAFAGDSCAELFLFNPHVVKHPPQNDTSGQGFCQ